jgi:hypothetical protein
MTRPSRPSPLPGPCPAPPSSRGVARGAGVALPVLAPLAGERAQRLLPRPAAPCRRRLLGLRRDADQHARAACAAVVRDFEHVVPGLGLEDRECAEAADREQQSVRLAAAGRLFQHLEAHAALPRPSAIHVAEPAGERVAQLGVLAAP